MDDNKYSLEDLVVSAIQQKPAEFELAFNDVIVDRLQTAIETKKQEIAQNFFNDRESEELEDSDSENTDTEENFDTEEE